MAKVAADAGADRIFLMGYDYRVASSSPGASAPIDRSDGGLRSLRWSLDLYQTLGVPADRLLLGLPLYGLTWPVAGPVIGAPETGRGDHWIPAQHRDILRDSDIEPMRDEVEQVDVYVQASDGSWGAPTPGASLRPGRPRPDVDRDLRRLARDPRPEADTRQRSGMSAGAGSGRSATSAACRATAS